MKLKSNTSIRPNCNINYPMIIQLRFIKTNKIYLQVQYYLTQGRRVIKVYLSNSPYTQDHNNDQYH